MLGRKYSSHFSHMTKLDDDNNTDYSFFEKTQIILGLDSAKNMLVNFINSSIALFSNHWGRNNETKYSDYSALSLSHVLLSSCSLYFQLINPIFSFICGVANVKLVTGVGSLSTGSAPPSKHWLLHLNFLFLEEVALPEAP